MVRPSSFSASIGDLTQVIAGAWVVEGDSAAARDALLAIAAKVGAGVVPSGGPGMPGSDGNFWFALAACRLNAAAPESGAWRDTFLPLLKRIGLALIAAGIGDLRMTDAGLLARLDGSPTERSTALNAIWYFLIAQLAVELKTAGDPQADHFDRLAGRFRRSYAKAAWLDDFNCVRDPLLKITGEAFSPDPDQLLLVTLQQSPLARTKQKQIAQSFRAAYAAGKALQPLHVVWLAEAIALMDKPPTGIADARALLAAVPMPTSGQLTRLREVLHAPAAAGPIPPELIVAAERLRVQQLLDHPELIPA